MRKTRTKLKSGMVGCKVLTGKQGRHRESNFEEINICLNCTKTKCNGHCDLIKKRR